MSDPKGKLERKAKKLIKSEYVIWLTTVDANHIPQPRPVWFIWDKDAFLIFSQPKAHKVQHIQNNGSVSLHFNTDKTGDQDVIVYIGTAVLDDKTPPAKKSPCLFEKVSQGNQGNRHDTRDIQQGIFGCDPRQADFPARLVIHQMTESILVGDRVKIYLDSKFGEKEGWYGGTVFRIDPYSAHRSFFWVELDAEAQALLGMKQISVLNPKNIQKVTAT